MRIECMASKLLVLKISLKRGLRHMQRLDSVGMKSKWRLEKPFVRNF